MSITLATAAKNAACDAIVDLLDVGGAGSLQIGTAGFASVLATLAFSNPAFGAAAAGTATANAIADDINTSSGTAAAFRARDHAGNTIFSGSVGVAAADILFSSVAFSPGGKCSISSLTLTVP